MIWRNSESRLGQGNATDKGGMKVKELCITPRAILFIGTQVTVMPLSPWTGCCQDIPGNQRHALTSW